MSVPWLRSVGRASLCALCAALASCAIYHPKALPRHSTFAAIAQLRAPRRTFGLPGLKPQPLDPAAGLTAVNIMQLAVAADPLLRAERARVGIARAQLFAAGLLPDPVLSGGLGKSPTRLGYSIGLMQDVRALVTLQAHRSAARARARQVDLQVLWQEWQVAERAQVLFIQARQEHALAQVLRPQRHLFGLLVQREQRAWVRGDVAAARAAAALAAWDGVQRRWRALKLAQNRTWHGLDALLGLPPGTRLALRGAAGVRPLSSSAVRAALVALPQRRPDLLALRAGYASGEQQLRAAILRQYPMLGLGVDYAHSADQGVRTVGFTIQLTLPLFNRNRGAIAVARATRAYLYRQYQARLDAALNGADQLVRTVRIMRQQLRVLDARVAHLQRSRAAADVSYRRGELTLAGYCAVLASLDAVRADAISLRAALQQARAALDMLLARPL